MVPPSLRGLPDAITRAHSKYAPVNSTLMRAPDDANVVAATFGCEEVTVIVRRGDRFEATNTGLLQALTSIAADSPTVLCVATLRLRFQADVVPTNVRMEIFGLLGALSLISCDLGVEAGLGF